MYLGSFSIGSGSGGYQGEIDIVGGLTPGTLTGLTPTQIQFGAADGSMTGDANLTYDPASDLLRIDDGSILIDGDLSFPALALHNTDNGSAALIDVLDDGAGELAAIRFGTLSYNAGAGVVSFDGILGRMDVGTSGPTNLALNTDGQVRLLIDDSGLFDFNGNRLTDLADGVDPQDAATISQLTDAIQTLIFGASSIGTSQNVKSQLNPGNSISAALTPANVTFRRFFFDRAAVVSSLIVRGGTFSQNVEWIVEKNGVDTALKATLIAGATTAEDSVNSFSVVAGDYITISTTPRNNNLVSGVALAQGQVVVTYD